MMNLSLVDYLIIKRMTSGLDNNFPSGLVIGKVTSVKKDNFDLEQIVSVKPSSNFDNINYVSILRSVK